MLTFTKQQQWNDVKLKQYFIMKIIHNENKHVYYSHYDISLTSLATSIEDFYHKSLDQLGVVFNLMNSHGFPNFCGSKH